MLTVIVAWLVLPTLIAWFAAWEHPDNDDGGAQHRAQMRLVRSSAS